MGKTLKEVAENLKIIRKGITGLCLYMRYYLLNNYGFWKQEESNV